MAACSRVLTDWLSADVSWADQIDLFMKTGRSLLVACFTIIYASPHYMIVQCCASSACVKWAVLSCQLYKPLTHHTQTHRQHTHEQTHMKTRTFVIISLPNVVEIFFVFHVWFGSLQTYCVRLWNWHWMIDLLVTCREHWIACGFVHVMWVTRIFWNTQTRCNTALLSLWQCYWITECL